MHPIISLFTPIFFVLVGLSIDLRAIDWSSSYIWGFSLTLCGIAIIGKMAGVFFIDESSGSRYLIGTSMIPRGEVAMIVALIGLNQNIIMQNTYVAIVLMSLLTTVIPPLILRNWLFKEKTKKKK